MPDVADPRSLPPKLTQPQLSLLVEAPPSGPDWAHELKYDGYRIHARLVRGETKLLTRTGLDWTDRYAATANAVSALGVQSAYLDGELCAVRSDGTTSFSEIQAATDERRTTNLVYFVFDLLFPDGEKVAGLPLLQRKERLKAILEGAPRSIQYSDHHIGDGQRFLQAACGAKAEGIISKRVDAPYVPGDRGLWRIAKCYQREESIIVGYSEPEGSRSHIGTLLLATRTTRDTLSTPGASARACPVPSCAACTEPSSRFAFRKCRSTRHRHERAVLDLHSISGELPWFGPSWSAKCAF
jgi:DNA ligase D-like protein (predicted ligase)